VPVVIVSSGMEPTLRGVLSTLLGEEDASQIDVICNSVVIEDGGNKWDIQYRHPSSGYGHDKSWAILPYRELAHRPTLFFFGDGVSGKFLFLYERKHVLIEWPDLSAAKHADLLFVKIKENGENDLATYCREHGIKHVEFKSFHDAHAIVEEVVDGKRTVEQVLAAGK
jgi:2-hydroxy-3-keto-5-methylthiopentenyl-1-phosphate phosphatase